MPGRSTSVEKQNDSRRLHRNRSRTLRSRSRNRRHGSGRSNHTPSPRRYRERSHSRDRTSSRHRHLSRSPRNGHRRRDTSYSRRDSPRDQALGQILARLNSIESRLPTSPTCRVSTPVAEHGSRGQETFTRQKSRTLDQDKDVTDKLVGALSCLVRERSHNFYISPFDPNLHDFDVWCSEVDRARNLNKWDDRECLGRIGSCLRGDAKSWLNDWVTSDRSWSNFKLEFRSLCPRNVDVATILFEVMCNNSNKFPTYAEYARKSLLRLNIVKGLSDELKVAIIVRGITDAQVKAAATNAKLKITDLVEFLSVYVKPKTETRSSNNPHNSNNVGPSSSRKREATKSGDSKIVCHYCHKAGHTKYNCRKRPKVDTNAPSSADTATTTPSTSGDKSVKFCTHCKRNGHVIDTCFSKKKSETDRNEQRLAKINFCSSVNRNETT